MKILLKNYDEDSDEGYIFEVDVEYLKDLHDLHSHLTFLEEIVKINKCNNPICNLYDKKKLCCSNKIFKRDVRS